MLFPKVPIQPADASKGPLIVVVIFCLAWHTIFISNWPALRSWDLWILFAIMLLFIFARTFREKKSEARLFDPAHIYPHLVSGLAAGGLLIAVPLLLDWVINTTSMSNHPLFVGAESRALEQKPLSCPVFIEPLLVRPLIGQVLLIGICLRGFAGRIKTLSFAIMTACLFPVLFWEFNLATFLVGGLSGWMFCFTGTLYAGWLFQMLCGLGGILIFYTVPRTLTILGFLF